MLLCLLVFFLFFNNRITAIEIRIQRLVGEVNLFDEKGKDLSLMEKMRLNSGQSLKTAEESLVMMSLDNTKLMTLEESSRAKIKASGKELEFQLAEGNLFFNINEKIKEDESSTSAPPRCSAVSAAPPVTPAGMRAIMRP